jgi:iron complex transport system substrate-binding protein
MSGNERQSEHGQQLEQDGGKIDYRARRAEQARAERRTRLLVGIAAAIAVALVLVFLGSRALLNGLKADDAGSGRVSDVSGVSSQEAGEGMRWVTDSAGRSVQVPRDPQHIAVMDSFSGELVVMIGAGDRLCGVPGGTKSDKLLQRMCAQLAGLPSLSGNAVNIEELVGAACDVAIAHDAMPESELAKLDRAGIPYVLVGYTGVDSQLDALSVVGTACGEQAEQKAVELRRYYDDMRANVTSRVAGVADADRVRVYHSINDALLCDGQGSLGASWIEETGCVDVSAGQAPTSDYDYNATLEQVYTWNPDLLVCNNAETAATMGADAQWAGLRAVREGGVHVIPTGATRWGHRGSVETPLAMLWLGTVAYPDLFADVDLKQTVVDYYRDYLGLEIDDETYASMISGEGLRTTGGGSGSGSGSGAGNGGGSGFGNGSGSGGGNGSGDADGSGNGGGSNA